jgi:hypothetical protein
MPEGEMMQCWFPTDALIRCNMGDAGAFAKVVVGIWVALIALSFVRDAATQSSITVQLTVGLVATIVVGAGLTLAATALGLL